MPFSGERSARQRRVLSAALALLALGALAWILRAHLGEWHRLREVPPLLVVGIVLLMPIARAVGAEANRVALAHIGHPIGRGVCFMLAMVTSYTNLFVPRSGLAAPAVYLRMRHHVPYAGYISVAFSITLLGACSVATCAVVLYAILVGSGVVPLQTEAMFFFGAVGVSSAFGLAAPGRVFGLFPERARTLLSSAHDAWLRVAESPSALIHILVLQLISIALRALKIQLAFHAVGAPISFVESLLVSLCADLGSLVSLTPAALGFREGALMFGAALLGLEASDAVLAAVVDRLASTLAVVGLGQIFVWRGLRGLGEVEETVDRDE
jgi:uncharacterized membrane protein YbhN (UPF0104 family)